MQLTAGGGLRCRISPHTAFAENPELAVVRTETLMRFQDEKVDTFSLTIMIARLGSVKNDFHYYVICLVTKLAPALIC